MMYATPCGEDLETAKKKAIASDCDQLLFNGTIYRLGMLANRPGIHIVYEIMPSRPPSHGKP